MKGMLMSEILRGALAPNARYPGSHASRGRWPLAYKYLIFRIYQSLGASGDAANREFAAVSTKAVADKIRFAAPDMYDWWTDTHPDTACTFEQWVRTTIYNRYFYMFTNVNTRAAEISTEHPDRWGCHINDTQEWRDIVAWVEERLAFGMPPEYCYDPV
jgi:hypothetical protein